MSEEKEAVRFFKEIGILKNIQRTGWLTLNLQKGDTISAHSHRTSIIAYYLAKKLKANIQKVLLMAMFHDVPEARSWDLNKITQRYVKADELKIIDEQFSSMPEIKFILKELLEGKTLEAKIVKDADLLECILQAKFYSEINKYAKEWIINATANLKLELSKKLAKEIKNSREDWWKGLKKFD